MIFRKRSVLHIFAIALCALALLLSLPYTTKATETIPSPDWINGGITANNFGEQAWSDADQSMYNNIPCETATAYSWGWQSNGWNSWKVKMPQTACVTLGSSAYVGFRQILPLGSKYWQALDLSDYYHAWMLPNSGANGLGIVTNSYPGYANTPSELYYTNDVLSLFNTFSKDSAGGVVRSPGKTFEHKLTYPDGSSFNFNNTGSVTYSTNGKWMYLNKQDTVQLRIDTSNFSVFSFAAGYNSQYSTNSSITNSGNTVATYSNGIGLKLYDLTRCEGEKPDFGSRNCASRDITGTVNDELRKISADTPVYILGIKFQSESKLRLLLQYRRGVEVKEGFLDLEVAAGEQPLRYLALGDSFSSGEGALSYRTGTNHYLNENNYNLCHQSTQSYPNLLVKSLSPDWFGDVACSGAVQKDITISSNLGYLVRYPQGQVSQNDKTELFINNVQSNILPGYIPQSSFLNKYSPSIVTVSVGGNDIGFGDIVTACVINKFFRNMQSCNANRFDREQIANSIDAEIPRLATMFRSIKVNIAGEQKLYVVGYPKLMNYLNTFCPLNTPMDQNEREFADNLVDYLNEAIKIAAAQAGARFLDMSTAFVGPDYDYRLCGESEQKAANGLTTAADSSRKPGAPVASESFHPNKFGQSLLARQIRLLTNDFTLKMPSRTDGTSSVPGTHFRVGLVGDAIITNPNQTFNYISDSVPTLIIGDVNRTITTITNVPGAMIENITASAELHSTPIIVGNLTVTKDNKISGAITIPDSISPGYHQLHILYTDSAGQEYDLYKYVLVAVSNEDFDGDGVANSAEACVVGHGSGIDSDKDGIDDACDGEYKTTANEKIVDITMAQHSNAHNLNLLASYRTKEQLTNQVVGGFSFTSRLLNSDKSINSQSQIVAQNKNTSKDILRSTVPWSVSAATFFLLAVITYYVVVKYSGQR